MNAWISLMIRKRVWVMAICLIFTGGLMSQLGHLAIVIDSNNMLPQSNPMIQVGREVEKTFGNKYTVVVTVTAAQGNIYQPAILEKVQRITDRLVNAPGVIRTNVIGLAARKAKAISGNAEGLTVSPLMEVVPTTGPQMDALRAAVAANPVYRGILVSNDEKTTQIVAEFRDSPGGMKVIDDNVRAAIAPEKDDKVDIAVGGEVIFLSLMEQFSGRMAIFLPLAILIVGFIHYEAFRKLQALFLPLVTALLAVIWAVSALAISGQPMDIFNAATPILILAIAAGHAVQILKRYYEEYAQLRQSSPEGNRKEQSRLAVLNALTRVGPVMVVACLVAALGFFSLVIFEIKSIRTFGILTGLGVLSALILELTFIPALRSVLAPPTDDEARRERQRTFWDRLIEKLHHLVIHRRKQVYVVAAVTLTVLSLGGYFIKIENSLKRVFYGKIETMRDDDKINLRMSGSNTMYVLVDAGADDSIKSVATLTAIDKLQRHLEQDSHVGKTVSIVDFIKRINQAMNADGADFYKLPESADLVGQYLFLYANSGEPGDFDSYVDNGYRKAVIQGFLKTDNSAVVAQIVNQTKAYADSIFPAGVKVSMGGGAVSDLALDQEMVQGKILNIVQILACVFIVSSIAFRSLLAGALILIPLIATVFANFGFMGLFGIPLNIPNALVSAMAVGVGADYAIYLSFRMREELGKGLPEADALRTAYLSAGKAIVFVSTAVAGGFGVLMLSWGFLMHIHMGFLIGLAMLVSSFSTLTVFASLLLTLRPSFIFSPTKQKPTDLGTGKFSVSTVLTLGLGLVLALPTYAIGAELSAQDIMQRNFLASKVATSTTDATFRLVNASGQERIRTTKARTKLVPGTMDNMRYVEFLTPSDVRGTKTLLIEHTGKDDDIWIYLPALKKVRRLVSSNKKDAFVGTDFSYGDVIGYGVAEWNHRVLKEEEDQGKSCYVIESLPKDPEVGRQSGYSKRISWIDKESFVMLRGEVFDSNGQLLKKISAGDLRKVENSHSTKWQPMKLTAVNVQSGHKTFIEFSDYKANVEVGNDVFTANGLEK